ncbi:MAG: acylphosphatase [Candidatus Nezhaarchaeota archaeon]|nr:acylphosphatase [Candidatus Nezhaarchaeota archaeon]
MSGERRAVKLLVKGRVQRVGFRRYALDLAQELGLSGYVKNLPNGSVEVFVQGAQGLVSRFVEALKSPPPPIAVKEVVEVVGEPSLDLKEFKVVYGGLVEELQEGFGAMQSMFMEYWKEFRGFREEFRDYREEFRGFADRTDKGLQLLLEKYGEISEKLTVILETLVKESKETREQLAKAINRLAEAVEALKRAR